MKTKMIATIIALGMVVSAFSMLAVAAPPEGPIPMISHTGNQYIQDGPGGVMGGYQNSAGDFGTTIFRTDVVDTVYVGGGSASYSSSDVGGYAYTTDDYGNLWATWNNDEWVTMIIENPVNGDMGYTCVEVLASGPDPDSQLGIADVVPVCGVSVVDDDVTVTWVPFSDPPHDGNPFPTDNPQQYGQVVAYNLYRASTVGTPTWNDNIGMGPVNGGPAAWTLVQAGATSPFTDLDLADGDYYYSVKPVFAGTTNVETQYGGLASPAATISGPGATHPPETTINAETGVILDGDISDKTVTITCTVTDVADGDFVDAAQIEIPTGSGTWEAMTMTSGGGTASETFEYVYTTPVDQASGTTVDYIIQGSDVNDGFNTTSTADSFTYNDITDPEVGGTITTGTWLNYPTDGYTNGTVSASTDYGDFSDIDLVASFFEYQFNAEGWFVSAVGWDCSGFTQGSYHYSSVVASVDTSGRNSGDTLEIRGTIVDSVGETTTLGAGGPITLDDPPLISDPYPIYGYVYLYDGDSVGGYAPQLAPDTTPVTAYYYNTTGVFITEVGAVAGGLGQYTLDLDGLDATNAFGIEVVAGPHPTTGNMGYANITTADYQIGGSWIDVVCGVPYDVIITVPAAVPYIATSSMAFPTTFQIVDIDGVLAQGYFSFEGDMTWTSSDPAAPYPAVAAATFDGTASATPGEFSTDLTLITGGLQTIRIADENGGAAVPPWDPVSPSTNLFLTPWGAIDYQIGGAPVDGYLKDWNETQVQVMAGGFQWQLVANGWNLVSAPQDPVMKQTNGVYDAADALAEVGQYIIDAGFAADGSLQMANRLAGGAYEMATPATLEVDAFLIDSVHGYWIYAETTIDVTISAVNYTAVGVNVLNAAGGDWEIVGFTHNFTAWTEIPTASDFTDGTFGPDQGVTNTKIVVTRWDPALQHYYSYVVDDGFPGMVSRDWTWDMFAAQPGNGFFLYLDAAATITFPLEY